MINEQSVALNQGSGGDSSQHPNVRTRKITIVQADGTLATLLVQVIAITDENGLILSHAGIEDTLREIASTLNDIKELLEG